MPCLALRTTSFGVVEDILLLISLFDLSFKPEVKRKEANSY